MPDAHDLAERLQWRWDNLGLELDREAAAELHRLADIIASHDERWGDLCDALLPSAGPPQERAAAALDQEA